MKAPESMWLVLCRSALRNGSQSTRLEETLIRYLEVDESCRPISAFGSCSTLVKPGCCACARSTPKAKINSAIRRLFILYLTSAINLKPRACDQAPHRISLPAHRSLIPSARRRGPSLPFVLFGPGFSISHPSRFRDDLQCSTAW